MCGAQGSFDCRELHGQLHRVRWVRFVSNASRGWHLRRHALMHSLGRCRCPVCGCLRRGAETLLLACVTTCHLHIARSCPARRMASTVLLQDDNSQVVKYNEVMHHHACTRCLPLAKVNKLHGHWLRSRSCQAVWALVAGAEC